MKTLYVLLITIFLSTTSLLVANNNRFPKKVFRDACHDLSFRERLSWHIIVNNSSDELRDSVINFINNKHNNAIETDDTLFVCGYWNDGSYTDFSIIYKNEVLFFDLKHINTVGRFWHSFFDNIRLIPVPEYFSGYYMALLKNWRTDILKTDYIQSHFDWFVSDNYCITRLIYRNEKLIQSDHICHDVFEEMYK